MIVYLVIVDDSESEALVGAFTERADAEELVSRQPKWWRIKEIEVLDAPAPLSVNVTIIGDLNPDGTFGKYTKYPSSRGPAEEPRRPRASRAGNYGKPFDQIVVGDRAVCVRIHVEAGSREEANALFDGEVAKAMKAWPVVETPITYPYGGAGLMMASYGYAPIVDQLKGELS